MSDKLNSLDYKAIHSGDGIDKTIKRLINQLWKLIPMRENEEDWKTQLDSTILEISGLNFMFGGDVFLQLLSKLYGLQNEETAFSLYRKTVFEAINLLQKLKEPKNASLQKLMAHKMGLINYAPTNSQPLDIEEKEFINPPKTKLDGIYSNAYRLRTGGGYAQQSRMILDKKRTLDRALKYSYQGANVVKVVNDIFDRGEHVKYGISRALINPDKLKQNYDDKMFSVPFEEGFKEGDVFEWLGTNSYWLIYLQDIDEYAYFRSEIRRCQYQIKWQDEYKHIHSTYAAIRGPVETKIDYIQKHTTSIDNPNHTLNILMPRNEDTLKYFRRYAKFYLQDLKEEEWNVCWRVEAVDAISTPGIIEVNATEYYSNTMEDDIEEGIVGGLIVDPINPNGIEGTLDFVGKTFIKPKTTNEYQWLGSVDSLGWSVDTNKYPVKLEIDSKDSTKCTVRWLATKSGQFELYYGTEKKIIVVESLF